MTVCTRHDLQIVESKSLILSLKKFLQYKPSHGFLTSIIVQPTLDWWIPKKNYVGKLSQFFEKTIFQQQTFYLFQGQQ